jgi:hypothetical protein
VRTRRGEGRSYLRTLGAANYLRLILRCAR